MDNMTSVFYFLMCVAAVAGWAAIELVLWLLSHLTIGLA